VDLRPPQFAGLERRILFGSDTPTVAVSISDSIARVRAWRLEPGDEAAILGGTAKGLLDLARRGDAPRTEPGEAKA